MLVTNQVRDKDRYYPFYTIASVPVQSHEYEPMLFDQTYWAFFIFERMSMEEFIIRILISIGPPEILPIFVCSQNGQNFLSDHGL